MSLRLSPEKYATLCRAILERDRWKCRNCSSRNALHVHHVIFRSQQGPDEECNLVTLCSSCHEGVHRDIKDGQYGLTIKIMPEGNLLMMRRPGWRPK